MRITRALAALTLGLSLVLAGCGDDEPSSGEDDWAGSEDQRRTIW